MFSVISHPVDEWKTNLMSLVILFQLLCAQHVSDINISIFRSLQLCWWITHRSSCSQFVVCCSFCCGWYLVVFVLQVEALLFCSCGMWGLGLLKMGILMSETCWAHNNWNKITSDIKLVFHSSTIAMMHGPIHIRSHPVSDIFNILDLPETLVQFLCMLYLIVARERGFWSIDRLINQSMMMMTQTTLQQKHNTCGM